MSRAIVQIDTTVRERDWGYERILRKGDEVEVLGPCLAAPGLIEVRHRPEGPYPPSPFEARIPSRHLLPIAGETMSQSNIVERLRYWAQNEEMIDQHYTQHGRDCNEAAEEIEYLRRSQKTLVAERDTLENEVGVAKAVIHTLKEKYGYE